MKRKHHRKSFDWYGMKQRFSIRKYHFGAASVLIGTTLFLMGGPLIQAAEQSQNQTIVERDIARGKELSAQPTSSNVENSQKEKAVSVEGSRLKEARNPIVSKEKLNELVRELS